MSEASGRLLIRDADYVVTLDDTRRILQRCSVFVEGGVIRDVGAPAELDTRHLEACRAGGSVIEAAGRLVVPGYVDTHVHTFEHLSRGLIPDDLATQDWATLYARPFYSGLTEEEAFVSARLACAEMLRGGTTCFVDTNILLSLGHLDAVAQAVEESGMRAILGRGVFDRMPAAMAARIPEETRARILSPDAGRALAESEALLRRWTVRAGGRIRAWASIYGLCPYTSDELFAGVRHLADRYGVGAAFHIASSLGEARSLEARTGVWPITHLDRLGALGPNLLLTHCTAMREAEVEMLARSGTKVAFCPGAALRLGKGATRIGLVPEMLAGGVTVALGADGVSSSGSFDMTRLMSLVAGLFKDARMDPSLVPAEKALEMATRDGARACLLDGEIGSIEVGRCADLALYDVTTPEWVPVHDIVRNLVYCADARSVTDVIVDGRHVVRDGQLTTIDVKRAAAEAIEAGERIARRLELTPRTRWPLVGPSSFEHHD